VIKGSIRFRKVPNDPHLPQRAKIILSTMGDTSTAIDILDIRNCQDGAQKPENNIVDVIVKGLKSPFNEKRLPIILLWDERGLELYDKVTTEAPEYYLFGAESEILREHASEIAQVIQSRSIPNGEGVPSQVLLELGAGSLRKTAHILHAFADLVQGTIPSVTYFALDLEEEEIQRSLTRLLNSDIGSALQGKIAMRGLLGTYDNGIHFVQKGGLQDAVDSRVDGGPQLHLIFLGSSLGSFPRGEDAEFLRSLPLRPGSGDTLLMGLDHDKDPKRVELAYNDAGGHVRRFSMNGLKATSAAVGNANLFDPRNWYYVNSYDKGRRALEAYFKCVRPHSIIIPSTKEEVYFAQDELLAFSTSFKYSEDDVHTLFASANLRPVQRWMDNTSSYSLWLLERPAED